MDKRTLILNAFRPNAEIEDPEAFAGRESQILELSDSLRTDGTVPIIYGGRGLGKTSLGHQIARIALGDDALLTTMGKEDRVLPSEDCFVPFWVSCSDETKSKDAIIQRIINSAEGFAKIESEGEDRPKKTTFRTTLDLKVFQAEAIQEYEKIHGRKFSKLGIEDQFSAVVDRLRQKGLNRILFIIDELDRAASTKGLANFIKNVSSPDLKFVLVGIANTISTLLDDHESLQRSLHPVSVSRMTDAESETIITKVVTILNVLGIEASFSEGARKELVSSAGGYPWFVHILAQEALRNCWDKGSAEVNRTHVQSAIWNLAANRFAQQYRDCYQAAVRDSQQREIVLRLMAKWLADDVQLSEIYPVAKKLGITNPSNCKKDLMLKRHGEVIVNPPLHSQGVVRFRDSVFKRYVDLRRSIYTGVKDAVDSAWEQRHQP